MPNQNLEQRSEEVQEIIGHVPSWIIRWGISSIFMVLLIILFISWFVKYPDVVKGEALITTRTAPVKLVIKESGSLKLLVNDNSTIKKNGAIAYIENAANYNDVFKLEELINNESLLESSNFQLGEFQNVFSSHLLALKKIEDQKMNQPQLLEIVHLNKQINSLHRLNENLKDQLTVFKSELKLFEETHITDSILFSQEVISSIDFKNRTTSFLQQKRALKNQKVTILNNEYQIEELKKQISKLNLAYKSNVSDFEQQFQNSKQALISAISGWKQRYVVTAPLKGKISYLGFLQDGQYVRQGQNLFAVIPTEDLFYAQVNLPIYASGKVAEGQKVNIRLDNYPSNEYGMIIGNVYKIANYPSSGLIKDQISYTILVELANGLVTTYGKKLPSQQFLSGEVEVITKDLRILDRVFGWVRSL